MENLSDDSAGGNPQLSLREKIERFGPEAIPLIFPEKSKGAPTDNFYATEYFNRYCYNWPRRTLEQTREAEYQKLLYSEMPHNVGILQNGQFGAWDVDTDDPVRIKEFIDYNPIVSETFTTKGRRGFTAWFIIEGEAPEWSVILLKDNPPGVDDDLIEWRFKTKKHSIIHGIHPKGVPYTVLQNKPVLRVKWDVFKCPGEAFSTDWPSFGRTKTKQRIKSPRPTLSNDQSASRLAWIEKNYEVLDWLEDYALCAVRCKYEAEHSSDSGEKQCVIFTGLDEDGRVAYKCLHAHAARPDLNRDETRAINDAFTLTETIFLSHSNWPKTCQDVDIEMRAKQCFWRRSQEPPYSIWFWLEQLENPKTLSGGNFNRVMGEAAILFCKLNKKGDLIQGKVPKEERFEILESIRPEALKLAGGLSPNPILVKTDEGASLIGRGYCPELELIVLGKKEDISIPREEEGKRILEEWLSYWPFLEKIDRSRALAQMITPALLYGGFFKRPIPAFLITAEESGAGKTNWQRCVGWIYGHTITPIDYQKRDSSIGGMKEQLDQRLSLGTPFIFIDELTGPIKNTFLNSLLTNPEAALVRTPYGKFANVSVKNLMIQFAGVKGFVLDEQLANRSLPIRIYKPASYDHYYTAEGESLFDWTINNQRKLLGALYSVVAAWANAGSPSGKVDSRFPEWSAVINGILGVLSLEPVSQGLESAQAELTNPAATWFPQLEIALEEQGVAWDGDGKAKCLSGNILRSICMAEDIDVPGDYRLGLSERDLVSVQIKKINRLFDTLPKTNLVNDGKPVRMIGNHFLVPYARNNLNGNGKKQKYYVFSRVKSIPGEIEQLDREHDLTDSNTA